MTEKRKTPTWLDRFVVSNKRTTSTLPSIDNSSSSPPERDITEIDISNESSINLPGSLNETATQSTLNSAETTESESSDLLFVFDARPEAHDVDIGYQLSRKSSIEDEMKYRLLKQAFQPEKKYRLPARQAKGVFVDFSQPGSTLTRFFHTHLTTKVLSALLVLYSHPQSVAIHLVFSLNIHVHNIVT